MTNLAIAQADRTAPVTQGGWSRWLKQECGLSLKWKGETRFPKDGASYTLTTGLKVDGTPEQKAQALKLVETSSKAASDKYLMMGLTEMGAITARKADGDAVNQVTFRALAKRLEEYPADVALTAVRHWPDKSKWFPTWCDLKAECEALMRPRRILEAALRREAEQEPPVERPEADERKRMADDLRNMVKGMRA